MNSIKKTNTLIGVSYFHPIDAHLWGMVDYFLRHEAKKNRMDIVSRAANNTVAGQVAYLKEFIDKEIDVLLIAARASDDPALLEVVREILAMDIPVIAMDSEIGQNCYSTVVGADNFKSQELVAKYIFEMMGGKGKVAYIEGLPELEGAQLRKQGFYHALSQYPDVELLFEITGNYKYEPVVPLMLDRLQTHQDLDAVIAANDNSAFATMDVLDQVAYPKQVLVSGYDGHYEALLAIHQGRLAATVNYAPRPLALLCMELAKSALNGQKIPKKAFIDIDLVTSENLEEKIIEGLAIFPPFIYKLAATNEQLHTANEHLQKEIEEHKQTQRELRAHAETLEQRNQELQDFAYIASHDLQEPLRKVQIFGDHLQRKYNQILDSRGRDYLLRMQKASAYMQLMVEDLAAFSNVASRDRVLKLTDFGQVLRTVIDDNKYWLDEAGAAVSFTEMPIFFANPRQIYQLFQNLLQNSIKFKQKEVPPIIQINSQLLPDNVYEIVFSDNGIGFKPEYARRIFGVFQRLDGRSDYSGTGMGLAICRKVVENHHGTITVESIPGEGCTFTMHFPILENG